MIERSSRWFFDRPRLVALVVLIVAVALLYAAKLSR